MLSCMITLSITKSPSNMHSLYIRMVVHENSVEWSTLFLPHIAKLSGRGLYANQLCMIKIYVETEIFKSRSVAPDPLQRHVSDFSGNSLFCKSNTEHYAGVNNRFKNGHTFLSLPLPLPRQ